MKRRSFMQTLLGGIAWAYCPWALLADEPVAPSAYYVDFVGGDDNGAGTKEDPFKTTDAIPIAEVRKYGARIWLKAAPTGESDLNSKIVFKDYGGGLRRTIDEL
jgi:hypothetical protein